jgi:ribonuclease BN (tRNA processing enzyme)
VESSEAEGVRVTVLGSGTLIPDDSRRSACHLVEGLSRGGDAPWRILLDCGFGALHGMPRFGVDPRAVSHLVLSHFHLDHVGDLAPLLFTCSHAPPAPRTEPLTVIGPPGVRSLFLALEQAYGDFVVSPPFPLEVVEVARDGVWEDPEGRFVLRASPTRHTPHSVAWRVECTGGPVVGYTGDTGPMEGLGTFLAGSDLLIAECAFTDPPPWDGHLSPRGVAALAAEARPGLLVLTHLYPDVDREGLPEEVREGGWEGPLVVASDGDSWTLV